MHKRPMFIVFGDFNLDIEQWKAESEMNLIGWDVYPMVNGSSRDLRVRSVDYILVYAPGNMPTVDDGTAAFSPLPVQISGMAEKRIYRLSTKEGHHENNEVVFTTSDLRSKKIKSSAPLPGIFHLTSA